MQSTNLNTRVVSGEQLPDYPEVGVIYELVPIGYNDAYYQNRTDRNVPWITSEEQNFLHQCTVSVAGCGGMGGLIAATLLRLGVGEIRIADTDTFDVSNLNRQFAASQSTIGKSKAFETARMLRNIASDTKIVVYPQGVITETVQHFSSGCNIVVDLIEFWAIGSRLLLHKECRDTSTVIINCNTVGFASFLWKFTKEGMPLEEMLGVSYEQAQELQDLISSGVANLQQKEVVMEAILKVFVPEKSMRDLVRKRLVETGNVPIIASNPPMACGFASNHILLTLLSSYKKNDDLIVCPPTMPGYLMIDARRMQASVFEGIWWN